MKTINHIREVSRSRAQLSSRTNRTQGDIDLVSSNYGGITHATNTKEKTKIQLEEAVPEPNECLNKILEIMDFSNHPLKHRIPTHLRIVYNNVKGLEINNLINTTVH